MIEVYRHYDHARVGLLESLLQNAGIEVHMRNMHASTGITEVPIPEFYPRLCVINQEELEQAVALIQQFEEAEQRPLGPDWSCPACQEKVPDSMSECWSCQRPQE